MGSRAGALSHLATEPQMGQGRLVADRPQQAALVARACALLGWGLREAFIKEELCSEVVGVSPPPGPLPASHMASPGPRNSLGFPGWRRRVAVSPWALEAACRGLDSDPSL